VHFTNYSDGSIGILFDVEQTKNEKLLLLEKNTNLELAIKGSQDGYWEWDINTNELILSKKAKDILGYKEHEKEPNKLSDWMNLVESYDIARTNEALSLHKRGESSFIDVEHRIRTAKKELWVNFRGKGIYNAKGNITKVYGTIRDISTQKKKQISLTKQRDLFMSFMDNLPALSFIKDKQGRYIYINSYYQKLLGFRAWKNRTTEEIFGKEASKSILKNDREALYEGKYKHNEYISNEEGIKKLFTTYKFPIDSENDKVLCGFGLDVTQEKMYQKKTELYSKIFNSTNEAIILTDEKGITIAINDAFKTITGYSEENIIGKNPSIRKSGKHKKEFYNKMWNDLLTKGSWSGEMLNKLKNGTIHPELMNISTIKNESGKITNLVGVFQSIEQQKLIENRLKKMAHYDELTNLPNRTLFSDRLSQALQRAKRNNSLMALVFVDLDDFKEINDTLGHQAGDLVLKEVSRRLLHTVRDSDTVSRFGGDEFVVILEKISQFSDASHIAEKIIIEIQKTINLNNRQTCSIGASIGISIYPNHSVSAKQLLELADKAMYEAKHSGKNCYKFYTN